MSSLRVIMGLVAGAFVAWLDWQLVGIVTRPGAVVLPLVGYLATSLSSTFVAAWIGRSQVPAIILGCLFAGGAVWSSRALPGWLGIVFIGLFFATLFAGIALAKKAPPLPS